MPSALLIVDVQRALTEGAQACHDAAGVIDRINGVAARARAAAVPVVFIQHEAAGGGFVPGSRSWELAPALRVAPTDLRLRKASFEHKKSVLVFETSAGFKAEAVIEIPAEADRLVVAPALRAVVDVRHQPVGGEHG